ncbi:hypothetical protein ACHGLA_36400 [Streptomyces sp. YH02]|uniref:hypothetical protein n=1 Tax=Streptomyces sp. YH02 TaxID=3256999 RepID=UPI0037580AAD
MDMSDVMDRAELHHEVVRRLESEQERTGLRPRLEGRWAAAWTLFETACQFYGVTRPEELVRVVRRAHEQHVEWAASGMNLGLLPYMYDELAPGAKLSPPQIPVGVEWAARSFEAVRGGIRDEEFAQWVRVLDESLVAVGEELAGCPDRV